MRIKKTIALIIFSLSLNIGFGQIGGENVYEFLNLSPSARISALGDYLITIVDDDVALAYGNPALLNEQTHRQLSFNHVLHLGGINHGFFNYGHRIEKWDLNLHGGMKYVSYGDFDLADETGTISGSFKATELALVVGASKQLNQRFSVGSNLKLISSRFESFSSFGLAMDLSALFYNPESETAFTFMFKNVGAQLSTYQDERQDVAFDIQIGFSKKLAHLPFRLSIIAHDLHRWDLRYDNPNEEVESLFGDDPEPNAFSEGVDNFFRHLVFNGEFLLGANENLRLRFGYNHQRKKELSVSAFRSLGGFSYGFGIKVKKFRIDYGHSRYHLAGGTHHFSISTNLNEFGKQI